MKFINDDTKKLYWWNRNYFFAGTLLVVLINILIQVITPKHLWFYKWVPHSWTSVLSFFNLFQHFVSAFLHSNWQHVLLNMLCFLICGAWLERRKGTLQILGLVFVMAWVAEAFVGANDLSLASVGFSGVNYALYAYAIIDYCFLFRKPTRTKINVISGGILMALIYLAACFSGGTSEFAFCWYPYDFMHNMGHYSSFLAGAILGLTVQLVKIMAVKEKEKNTTTTTKE